MKSMIPNNDTCQCCLASGFGGVITLTFGGPPLELLPGANQMCDGISKLLAEATLAVFHPSGNVGICVVFVRKITGRGDDGVFEYRVQFSDQAHCYELLE